MLCSLDYLSPFYIMIARISYYHVFQTDMFMSLPSVCLCCYLSIQVDSKPSIFCWCNHNWNILFTFIDWIYVMSCLFCSTTISKFWCEILKAFKNCLLIVDKPRTREFVVSAIRRYPFVARHLFASIMNSCQFLDMSDNENTAISKSPSLRHRTDFISHAVTLSFTKT